MSCGGVGRRSGARRSTQQSDWGLDHPQQQQQPQQQRARGLSLQLTPPQQAPPAQQAPPSGGLPRTPVHRIGSSDGGNGAAMQSPQLQQHQQFNLTPQKPQSSQPFPLDLGGNGEAHLVVCQSNDRSPASCLSIKQSKVDIEDTLQANHLEERDEDGNQSLILLHGHTSCADLSHASMQMAWQQGPPRLRCQQPQDSRAHTLCLCICPSWPTAHHL